MANRYVLKFTKSGYAKYTSHLDMIRFFKRAFRKTGIALRYSQGFNPHPKMSFAQPLSLGYSSKCELLEFETEADHQPEEIFDRMAGEMPEGMKIEWCRNLAPEIKSLASAADSAEYSVDIPFDASQEKLDELSKGYLEQGEIIAMKRRKKDKKLAPVDIKKMIRSFEAEAKNGRTLLTLLLDCGSVSNCSPELVFQSFTEFAGVDIPRCKVEITREKINFVNNLQI